MYFRIPGFPVKCGVSKCRESFLGKSALFLEWVGGVYSVVATKTQILALNREGV